MTGRRAARWTLRSWLSDQIARHTAGLGEADIDEEPELPTGPDTVEGSPVPAMRHVGWGA